MNASNIKNTLTNIAAVLGAIAGVIVTISAQGIILPAWLLTIGGVLGALSIGIIGFYSGKNPDGSVKTPTQVVAQNTQAAVTKAEPVSAETITAMKDVLVNAESTAKAK